VEVLEALYALKTDHKVPLTLIPHMRWEDAVAASNGVYHLHDPREVSVVIKVPEAIIETLRAYAEPGANPSVPLVPHQPKGLKAYPTNALRTALRLLAKTRKELEVERRIEEARRIRRELAAKQEREKVQVAKPEPLPPEKDVLAQQGELPSEPSPEPSPEALPGVPSDPDAPAAFETYEVQGWRERVGLPPVDDAWGDEADLEVQG
jgi:hypothetical protein